MSRRLLIGSLLVGYGAAAGSQIALAGCSPIVTRRARRLADDESVEHRA
jgi:hypothetical protein